MSTDTLQELDQAVHELLAISHDGGSEEQWASARERVEAALKACQKKRVIAIMELDNGILTWETNPDVTDHPANIKSFQQTLRQMATALGEGYKRGKAKQDKESR